MVAAYSGFPGCGWWLVVAVFGHALVLLLV